MVQIKHLDNNEKKAVLDFVSQVRNKLSDKILGIFLYGSKARGDFHKESDVDILVISRDKFPLASKESDILSEIGGDILLKYDVYISVVNLSLADYQRNRRLSVPFVYWVEKEGKTLWQGKTKILKKQ